MMSNLTNIQGIIPATPVMYTDPDCLTVDYDAVRAHFRYLVSHEIAALCVGGHAGETECLTMDERLKIIDIAVDEAAGRVPVIGGVIADSTWSAIEQAKRQRDRGVDGLLVCAPTILAWDAAVGDEMLLAHFSAIDRQCPMPFIVYGGPGAGEGSTCRQLPATFTKVAKACENLVAWKIPIRGVTTGKNSLEECVDALREAEIVTGRRVSALLAGDFDTVGALVAGAQGNVNANESVRVEDNTAIYAAFKRGDIDQARQVQKRSQPLVDAIYGIRVGCSYVWFHYRGKIAAWMMGKISTPYMRLPQVPPPAKEIQMIYDALIASGKTPIHTPNEFFLQNRAYAIA
jgi:4-hydroxy-tetrahydrodipicolinate synthase